MTRQARVRFEDLQPPKLDFLAAVIDGLSSSPKSISPKFFYDARGSRLFDKICDQPEYYPPDAEREILESRRGEIAGLIGENCVLIEPGAGSSVKVRLFLEQLRPSIYVPLDISKEHLLYSTERLADDYPWLKIHAACVDYSHRLELPADLPRLRRVAFFPGSSLGNFDRIEALQFLREIRDAVMPGGILLIGVDTKKDSEILNAAYNDKAGVTAAFNRNLLLRMRRELSAVVDIDAFEHSAFYSPEKGRIEMHLVSVRDQAIEIDRKRFFLARGESIHTENSYKYHPEEFVALAKQAGFKSLRTWRDSRMLFSVHCLAVETTPAAL